MSNDTTYLVTGGTGAMGTFLVRLLVERGSSPVVLTSSGDTSLIADVAESCRIVRGAVDDLADLEALVRTHRVTHIAHLASPLLAPIDADPPAAVRAVVEGTANILEAASRQGVRRVVFTSSKAVYGPYATNNLHPDYDPMNEDFPCNPPTLYGTLKLSAENLGAWYARERGLSFIALRFSTTVGPGKLKRHTGATALYSQIVENGMLRRPLRIERGRDGKTDAIFNGDAARGVVHALDVESTEHSVFNICTGDAVSVQDFVDAVATRCPGAAIEVGPGPTVVDLAGFHCVLDGARAERELGFVADGRPERMIEQYIAAMETMKLAPTPT